MFNKNDLLPVFTKSGAEQQKEKDKLKWLVALNEVRRKTAHPNREAITKDEYEFTKDLSVWLLEIKEGQNFNQDINEGFNAIK